MHHTLVNLPALFLYLVLLFLAMNRILTQASMADSIVENATGTSVGSFQSYQEVAGCDQSLHQQCLN